MNNVIDECEKTQMVARNDFTELVLSKHERRRCLSVPSSMRLNIGRDKVQDHEIAQLVNDYFSDLSADCGATSDEEPVDSAPTNLSKSQNTWAPECATHVEMTQLQQAMPATSYGYPIEPIMDVYSQPTEKAKLNYHAEPYEAEVIKSRTEPIVLTRACCFSESPPGGRKWRRRLTGFRWECREVMMAAKEAMEHCAFVQRVEVLMEKNKSVVDAYICPEDFECKEQALSKAKQACLFLAENSKNVYVIGYCSNPFMTTPDGFSFLLGTVSGIREPCWETFCYGYCGNGDACTMEHPEFRMIVDINIKFETQF